MNFLTDFLIDFLIAYSLIAYKRMRSGISTGTRIDKLFFYKDMIGEFVAVIVFGWKVLNENGSAFFDGVTNAISKASLSDAAQKLIDNLIPDAGPNVCINSSVGKDFNLML